MSATYSSRIDGLLTSLAVKVPARVVATANVTLSGIQSIDGISLATGDRVLVIGQTDSTENGVWDVATSAWTRSLDFNGERDVSKGTLVYVSDGTVNANKFFSQETESPEIGVTDITFLEYQAPTTTIYVALLDDVAALRADTNLTYTIGQPGTVSAGDAVRAGPYDYEVAASGATDHHLTNSDSVKLYVTPIGGVYNVDAVGPVTTARFNAFALQIADIAWAVGTVATTFTLKCSSSIETDEQLVVTRTGGGQIRGLNIDLGQMEIKSLSGGSLTSTTPVLYITCRTCQLHVGYIDCNRVSSGAHMENCNGTEMWLDAVRRWPTPGDTVFGWRIDGSTTRIAVRRGWGIQWDTGDAEYSVLSNFTGRLFWLDGIDFSVANIAGGWCGVPIYVGPATSLLFMHDIHPYNGNTATPRTDPVLIENYSAGDVYIADSYFDNGLIHDYSGRIRGRDCHMLELASNVTLTDPEVRIYCTAANDGLDPNTSAWVNCTSLSIGYVDDITATYSWGGDYSEIANSYDEQNQQSNNVTHTQREIKIYTRDDDISYVTRWKPGGIFREVLYSGTDTGTNDVDLANNITTFGTDKIAAKGWQFAGATAELTISGGSITPTGHFHTVDTESDAASDDVTNIATANIPDGSMLTLCSANNARTVNVLEGGNLDMAQTSISLNNTTDTIMFVKFGSRWRKLSSSNND